MLFRSAMVCDSPIVLIDELENAGIDKKRAFGLLADSGKLILIVTHDPHTALMASRRIILEGGAIVRILERSKEEALLSGELDRSYERQRALQQRMRKGERLI